MKNPESSVEKPDNKQHELLKNGVQEFVSEFPLADLGVVKEFIDLPSDTNKNYEAVLDFVYHHGRGFVNTILQRFYEIRQKVGVSEEEFQKALSEALGHLEV